MGVPFVAEMMTGNVAAASVKNPLVMPRFRRETCPDTAPKTNGTSPKGNGGHMGRRSHWIGLNKKGRGIGDAISPTPVALY